MLLGPLFRVEMVTVARRRRYFLLRTVYGALALFILWSAQTQMHFFSRAGSDTISIQQGAQLATSFFIGFSWLQMLVIFTVGPALAVGTIATERERRTIEYLFTTDLSNAEIILGKLVARLCLLGQLLLVGLPILFLFRLLGGISAQLLMVTFLLAASASLLIAALSICVSVWSERARYAIIRVYLILGALTFLPMIFQAWSGRWFAPNGLWNKLVAPVLDFCIDINPLWGLGNTLGNASAIGANLDMQLIWLTVGKQLLISVAAISLAIFAVRRVHLKEASQVTKKGRRPWQIKGLSRWRRPLANDPMIWKELFAGSAVTKLGLAGRISVALILLTICGSMIVSAVFHLSNSSNSRPSSYFHSDMPTLSGLLSTGILLLLAVRAAGLMTSEKERDCWLSLVATPLTGCEIIHGKMWGNLYSMRWPFLVLASNWVLGVLLDPGFLLAALWLLATFMLMACYVTNLGLRFSLQSQTTMRAVGATLGTLIFTGGGYMFCCCMVASTGSGEEITKIFLAGCIPFLMSFPILAFLEVGNEHSFFFDTGLVIAYVVGIGIYLLVTVSLHMTMISGFDHFAGRTGRLPEGSYGAG